MLELRKLAHRDLHHSSAELDARARWMHFLKEGGRWSTLPAALRSPEMVKAMRVLHRFGDAQRDLALYQSRMDYLRLQRTLEQEEEETAAELAAVKAALAQAEAEREQERADNQRLRVEKERERAEKERERAEKERERAEKERLRARLIAAGLFATEDET